MSIYIFTSTSMTSYLHKKDSSQLFIFPKQSLQSYLMMISNSHHDLQESSHNFNVSTLNCTKLCTKKTNSLFQASVLTVIVNASNVTASHCSCCCDLLFPIKKFTYASMLVLAIAPFKWCQMKLYFSLHRIVLQVVLSTWLIHHMSEPFKY